MTRQLAYQRRKAELGRGSAQEWVAAMAETSAAVRAQLETVRRLGPETRVLEVGSGSHGLVFHFGGRLAVGLDPLAVHYASLFPAWQRRVPTVAASGADLPFPEASFDVVLCDNVVDHADRPARIVAEMARVLTPGGLLYFTVNVHHPVYRLVAAAHSSWNALGVPVEIAAFADHTVHLSPRAARALFDGLALSIVRETADVAETRANARRAPVRSPGDVVRRLFFKNARYELVAVRQPAAVAGGP